MNRPNAAGQPQRGSVAYPAVLTFCVLLCYHNSFSGAMLFDDHGSIINNPVTHDLTLTRSSLTSDLRPLTTLTLALNYSLGALDVWGYHAFNISIHVLASLALFGLIRRTLLLPQLTFPWPIEPFAFSVALLWAIHPLQTESVSYLVQRAQSLFGLFLFLTLYSLARSASSPRRNLWSGLAVVFCALGMASKQDMVVAPVIAVVFDRIFLSGSWREVVRKRWPIHLALFATWLVLTPSIRFALYGASIVPAQPGTEPLAVPPPAPSLGDRSGVTAGFALVRISPVQYALTQPAVILHYLRLAVWPSPLSFDYYDWPVARTWADAALPVAGLALLLAATAFALIVRPTVGFVALFFFLTLAPTSSVLPIDDVAAERRMYLPLAALVTLFLLAWRSLGDRLVARRTLAPIARQRIDRVAFAVTALALAGTTISRNEDYRSQVAMWTHAAEVRPENARAWHNLAVSLVDEDRRAEAVEPFRNAARLKPDSGQYAALAQCLAELGRPAEAEVEYQKAVELLPTARGSLKSTPATLYYNWGKTLDDSGRADQAEAAYRESVRLDPKNFSAHVNLATLLLQRGEPSEGIAHLQSALAIDPESALALNNLGLAYARQEQYPEAVLYLRRALEREPGFIRALDNLGTVYFKQSNYPASIASYEQALARQPGVSRVICNLAHAYERSGNRERAAALYREVRRVDPGRPRALADLAWTLAANPDARRRDPVEAVRLAELAVEATERRDPICLDASATAYANVGRFPEAIEAARAAIAIFAPTNPRAADAVRKRLQLYERGEPYRDPP